MLFRKDLNVYRLLILSVILAAIFAVIEVLIKYKKVHFFVEKIPAFYVFLGFVSAIIIIFTGYLMKKAGLKKGEHYYD